MLPVFEARDVIGREILARGANHHLSARFRITARNTLFVVPRDLLSGEVILLYDVHRGKTHHRHLQGKETSYRFVDEDKLLDDFLRDVVRIVEGKL